MKPFRKGRETGLLIPRTTIGVSNADAGIDLSFAAIKTTAVLAKDSEQ